MAINPPKAAKIAADTPFSGCNASCAPLLEVELEETDEVELDPPDLTVGAEVIELLPPPDAELELELELELGMEVVAMVEVDADVTPVDTTVVDPEPDAEVDDAKDDPEEEDPEDTDDVVVALAELGCAAAQEQIPRAADWTCTAVTAPHAETTQPIALAWMAATLAGLHWHS